MEKGRRPIQLAVLKILAIALLIAGHTSVVGATRFYCSAQHPNCSESEYCEGTGYAWAGCEIWCYINQGQELSGYADCVMIEG